MPIKPKPPSPPSSFIRYSTPEPVIDHAATGAAFRQFRVSQKVSLRQLADLVGISAAYLSDLELGRRQWTVEKEDAFRRVLIVRLRGGRP